MPPIEFYNLLENEVKCLKLVPLHNTDQGLKLYTSADFSPVTNYK